MTTNTITTTYVPIASGDYISGTTKSWSLPIKKKQYNFSGVIPNRDIYIKRVIYSEPATVVFWNDGTKTVCKCTYPDVYSKEVGLSLCILKKIYGVPTFKKLLKDWVPVQDSFVSQEVSLKDVMKNNK